MLAVSGLKKSYNNRQIISNFSINIKSGEIFGILGPNGAGKTTIFDVIAGFIKPDSGNISLFDNDITNLPMHIKSKMGIGYLCQESSIFGDLTVIENILISLESLYTDKEVIQTKLNQLLNEFSLNYVKNSLASSLSGGENRRTEIARLLARQPQFILFDEIFAGIDPISIGEIVVLIRQLSEKNIGILITDHNAAEILRCCHKICVVYDGKIIIEGDRRAILSNKFVQEMYLGEGFNV